MEKIESMSSNFLTFYKTEGTLQVVGSQIMTNNKEHVICTMERVDSVKDLVLETINGSKDM